MTILGWGQVGLGGGGLRTAGLEVDGVQGCREGEDGVGLEDLVLVVNFDLACSDSRLNIVVLVEASPSKTFFLQVLYHKSSEPYREVGPGESDIYFP
jgi:hypothetical protein